MQDAKEEVRARLAIEDVIGEYVELKRAGRNFKGLSPFNDERTPSFVVSPDKHIWHDFSSGKGGDVFSFVMAMDGIDFKEALEKLARKAGVDLSLYQSAQQGKLGKQKARLRQALDIVARVFQRELLSHGPARQYAVEARGLGRNVIRDFCIGYAPPGRDGLVQLLRRRGFSQQELMQAGLVNQYGGDLFRDRLMVPLMDASGRVIGFTGRLIHDDIKAPKYLNTPATLLYDKSRHVFGLSQAKAAIREEGFAVIVEGNMDVVSSHQAGVRTAVATAGTAMTEHHIRAIARLSGDIRLAYDSDEAGLAATERAIVLAQTVGVELRVVELPAGVKDPDELIQRDAAAWKQAIVAARPAVEWVLDRYASQYDLTAAAGRRQFSTAAAAIIQKLQDPVEAEYYWELAAKRLQIAPAILKQKAAAKPEAAPVKRPRPHQTQKQEPEDAAQRVQRQAETELLAVLLLEPTARPQLAQVPNDFFMQPSARQLAEFLQRHQEPLMGDELPKELHSAANYVKIVQLYADEKYHFWDSPDRVRLAGELVQKAQRQHKQQQKQQLEAQLRDAEELGDTDRQAEVLQQIQTLIRGK